MSEMSTQRSPNAALSVLYEEARRWGITRSAAVAQFLLPFFVLASAAVVRLLHRPLMRWLAEEDGPFEWIQAVGFAAGAILAGVAAWRLARGGRWVAALLFAGLALGLVFVAGEEIAWGQRIFQFATPDELARINEKAEVSVHNISSLAPMFTVAKLIAGIYGSLAAWVLIALRRRWSVEKLEVFVVPVFLSSPFLIVLAMRLMRLTVLRHTVPLGYAELEELFLAWGMAQFTWYVARRLARWPNKPLQDTQQQNC
jgi:hypothetical protein